MKCSSSVAKNCCLSQEQFALQKNIETKMNHNLGDGSWTLTVFVTDLQVERSLRVRGDLHIGGVMIRLVDELGKRSKINS